MLRMLFLALCGLGLLTSTAAADSTVYFRGKRLTPRHFIYGEVTSATRTIGTVNLGYGHGLEPGEEIAVVRRFNGQLVPIGVLRLSDVRAGESRGDFEGELSLQRSDLVVISARNLNLWDGRSRSEHAANRALLNDRTKGYDSAEVSPSLLRELGKDDGQHGRKPDTLHVNADLYATRREFRPPVVVRGAFVPAGDAAAADKAAEEYGRLKVDQPTRDLESALVAFTRSNAVGKINLDSTGIVDLAITMPGVDPDELQDRLNLMNLRVQKLLMP